MFKLTYKEYLAIAIFVAVVGVFSILQREPKSLSGATFGSNRSTTTPQVADATNLCPQHNFNLASSTTGTLVSVNITVSGGGELKIYDATTTNNSLRASAATSSLELISFPASATVGSYGDLDIEFKRGLLVDYTTTGTGVSSSTIAYRCGS